jgi:enamine deaminase RidA (YjgF/YER057c/UK114 family)
MEGANMEREFINPKGGLESVPRGYSHVVKVRNPGAFVFIAGQGPVDENLELVGAGDIEAQTRATFENIKRNLEVAGARFSDIVKMQVFVSDIATQQWPVRNVRAEYIDIDNPSVSTMIEVSKFAIEGMMIEIDVIAVIE